MANKQSFPQIRSCSHKVHEAYGWMLDKYPHKELAEYARSIGVAVGKTKQETIDNLVRSGKATICAWLGN